MIRFRTTGLIFSAIFFMFFLTYYLAWAQSATFDGFQSGFNQFHTNKSNLIGPASPKILWKQKIVNSPGSAVVDDDDNIYLPNESKLVCVNSNGAFKWSVLLAARINQISVSNSNNLLLVGSSDHKFNCISTQGKLVWNRSDIVAHSVTNKAIFAVIGGSYQTTIQAISFSGKTLWTCKLPYTVTAPPAIGNDNKIYIVSSSGTLISIGAGGIVLWKKHLDTVKNITFNSAPAIGSDNSIYIASNHNYLYAVKPDGSLAWKFTADGRIAGGVAIGANDNLFVGGLFYKIIALDKTGKVLWKVKTNGFLFTAPVLDANDNLYYVTAQYSIVSLDPTGNTRWSLYSRFPQSAVLSPNFLSNKTLIIGNLAIGD